MLAVVIAAITIAATAMATSQRNFWLINNYVGQMGLD